MDRSLSNALAVGQTLEFKWAVNWDSGGGNKGFNLYTGGPGTNQIVNVNQGGFPGNITFNGVNAITNHGTGPMTWKFTLISSNTLLVTSSPRDGSTAVAFANNLSVAGAPKSFRFYATDLANGDRGQPYFNDFSVGAAVDADGDGMPDEWELAYFGNTTSQVANGDADNDGLQNLAEFNAGTIPNLADTDGDGLKDGFEVGSSGYQVVLGSFTWETALLHANAKGGHLATITSDTEKNNIAAAVTSAEMNELWLGGYKSGTNWSWVTGETWDESAYNNWMPGEPGNTDGQNYLRLKAFAEGWDNWFSTPTFGALPVTIRGYLLEKTRSTDPTKFNYPLITVAGTFQDWSPVPTPAAAPKNVLRPVNGEEFGRELEFYFDAIGSYEGKFVDGQSWSSPGRVEWGAGGGGQAVRNGGSNFFFRVTATGIWRFYLNTETLASSFSRKTYLNDYAGFATDYGLPPDSEAIDSDFDGLTNQMEAQNNTNPLLGDTDGDGLLDGDETLGTTSANYFFNAITYNSVPIITNPLLADTDGDGLPDRWEIIHYLVPTDNGSGATFVNYTGLSGAGNPNGGSSNPDGDPFTNLEEFEGGSSPIEASSQPANRAITFRVDMTAPIAAKTFVPASDHKVELLGTFNGWSRQLMILDDTDQDNIWTGTFVIKGTEGTGIAYKFYASGGLGFEAGSDRSLNLGVNQLAQTLPVATFGEARNVTFAVNMGVQATLGRFTPGTDKVYLVGDVVGGWDPGVEMSRVGSTSVYTLTQAVAGPAGQTRTYKFRVNNSLAYENDFDPVAPEDQPRVLTLEARDVAQTVTEVYFNNVSVAPANRTVTFAVNMNIQTNANKLAFDPAKDFVELRGDFNFFGGGTDWRLTNNGAGIYTRSFVLTGNEGVTNAYKYVAVMVTAANTNSVWERVDMPRTNQLANRTFVLGATNTNQVVHSVASPALFSDDDGVGPTDVTLFPAAIAENNSLGATVGVLSSTGDTTLGDTHTYSLVAGAGDTDNGSFSITGSDLKIGVVADYESPKTSYFVRVRSTDVAGNFFEKAFTISVSDVPEGPTFGTAYAGKELTNRAANGLTYLVNYAFGGSDNTEPKLPSLDTSDTNKLALVAFIRTNNSVGTLQVKGEKADSLGNWDTNNPILGEAATDQTGAPEGTQKQIFSTPKSGDRQFLRLKATLAP